MGIPPVSENYEVVAAYLVQTRSDDYLRNVHSCRPPMSGTPVVGGCEQVCVIAPSVFHGSAQKARSGYANITRAGIDPFLDACSE